MIVDDVKAHPQTMFARDPGERIAESYRVLILRAVTASAATGEQPVSGAPRPQLDSRLAEEIKHVAPDHGLVSSQIALIESRSGQELAERLINPGELMLSVEAAARLVDYTI